MADNITQIFRAQATKYGTREALRFKYRNEINYKSIGWNEVISTSDNISMGLLSMGFGAGDNIGIFSDNRPEWILTDLGILAIGAVVVPFYATASKQNVKYIADETDMKIMFVGNQEQLDTALWMLQNSKTLQKVIVFEAGLALSDSRCTDWREFCQLASKREFADKLNQAINTVKPADLATIVYTSGTTGEPKGVMLHHSNFLNSFQYHDERLNISESDISLCFLPLSHIFERSWTFYLLYRGAVNVILENPRAVIEVLPIVKPTVMCVVPRFFEKTYEGIQSEAQKWSSIKQKIFNWSIGIGMQCAEYKCKTLSIPAGLKLKQKIADKLVLKKLRGIFGDNFRFLPCAGAAIRPELLRFFHATGLFVNYGYGATETTATVSCFKDDVWNFETSGSIMPHVSVKISADGEIMVKGKTVFSGYYKKPDETAKSLIDGWYMTGDKGYLTKDNDVVMVDRMNDLFKTSGGKFVSPQKVELLIGQDQYIQQIVIIGANRKFVTAIIVPSFENLAMAIEKLGLDATNPESIVANKAIFNFLKARIDKLQEELTPYERVVNFILLAEPFSIENNTLTSSLKTRRKIIIEKYKDIIEKMYLTH